MASFGSWTSTSNTCNIGSCPATTSTITSCKTCYYSITLNQGCTCSSGTATPNCVTCDAGSCSICNHGFYLTAAKTCAKCEVENCTKCFSVDSCYACDGGFNLSGQRCGAVCSGSDICDTVGKVCGQCVKNCAECDHDSGFVIRGEDCVKGCFDVADCGNLIVCPLGSAICKAEDVADEGEKDIKEQVIVEKKTTPI